MNSWVGAAAVIGTGSLGGFAIGALMSGSCALAITAPRRARAPQAPAAQDGGALMAMRGETAREAPETREGRETAREGKAAGGYRSKHRRGDPVPGSVPGEGAHPGTGSPDGPLGDRTFGSPRRPARHAAPSVSLVSRMSGLLAPRALASGARG